MADCAYCGRETLEVANRPYNPLQRTRDHEPPRCRREPGERSALLIACRECNGFKGSLTAREFELATNIMEACGFALERAYGRLKNGALKPLTHHQCWPRIKAVMGPAYGGKE